MQNKAILLTLCFLFIFCSQTSLATENTASPLGFYIGRDTFDDLKEKFANDCSLKGRSVISGGTLVQCPYFSYTHKIVELEKFLYFTFNKADILCGVALEIQKSGFHRIKESLVNKYELVSENKGHAGTNILFTNGEIYISLIYPLLSNNFHLVYATAEFHDQIVEARKKSKKEEEDIL